MDMFKSFGRSLTSPPENAGAITPGVPPAQPPRAIYVGSGGDLVLEMLGGSTVTLLAVPTGSFLPLRIAQVVASGTDADGIVGFW